MPNDEKPPPPKKPRPCMGCAECIGKGFCWRED